MPRMYMHLSGRATLSGELPRPFIAAHGPKSPRKVQNHYLVAVLALLPSFLSLSAWFHVPIYSPTLLFTLSLFSNNLFLLAICSRSRRSP